MLAIFFKSINFFLNNLQNSSQNSKSTSSNSTTYWRPPYIKPREEDYVEPWKRQIVIWDIRLAYEKAVNKIIKNCGKWNEGDRKCIKEAANKALLSGPLIWVYSDTYLHGSGTNYYPPVKRGLIKIYGYEHSDPDCQLYNLMLHEMLHVGGLPGGIYEPGQKKEKRVEACTNLCFQGEEEECQRHSYSSVPEDCKCKDPNGDGDGDGPDRNGESRPGADHPDDNESSATGNPSYYASASKARFYRLAPKKGKPNILLYWNFEKLLDERDQYFESVGTGGTPDETYLVNLNSRINEAYNLLSKNSLQYSKERSETPDVVILRHGYFGLCLILD